MSKLIEALRFQGRFGHETEDQARARKVNERIAAADELEALAASHQRLKEALERIAAPGYGIELDDGDKERADYWAEQTEKCRGIAREALKDAP